MQLFVRGNDIKTVSADNSQPISQFKVKQIIKLSFIQLINIES